MLHKEHLNFTELAKILNKMAAKIKGFTLSVMTRTRIKAGFTNTCNKLTSVMNSCTVYNSFLLHLSLRENNLFH